MIVFAKLPLEIDYELIRREVGRLLNKDEWSPHYNKLHYDGAWDVLPLRAPGGKTDNPFADLINQKSFENTPLMAGLPAINDLLESLKCEKLSARLLNLKAGSSIKTHRDYDLAYEKGEARLHFPVFTNSMVNFNLDGESLKMEVGECWYINANLPHSAVNNGSDDRIHLVVDCKVNDWLVHLFSLSEKRVKSVQKNLQQQMEVIKSLRLQNTLTANSMADKLQEDLDKSSLVNSLLDFLDQIGIAHSREPIEEQTFLPGLKLRSGTLIVDEEKLLYPGDILHEAGHLATMPPEVRATMNDNLESNDLHNGGEMMAIAWSYAASMHLKLDPYIVFHNEGYKGGGDNIVQNFSEGKFFGVPLLQWCGMTYDEKTAKQKGVQPFPAMTEWTCKSRPS
jgi:hypothetical protein